jgi:hypothetical protein
MLTDRGEQSKRFPIPPPDQAAKLVKPSRIEEDRSMRKGSLRSVLLSSAAATMLIASAGTANAIEYNFGSVQVFFDTTVSAGASLRTASTNTAFLPTANGGPLQQTGPTDLAIGAAVNAPTGSGDLAGGALQSAFINAINTPTSISGSINTDDGRLNFDRGDLIGNTYKMTNDIQAKWENYTFFARLNSYYDAVLDSDSSFNRSKLVDGKADAARDIRLLDLYLTADYNIGDFPVTIRAGKQAINWGESTFLLNGVNGSMPIDVNAFRRPGAEVREGFIPIWAIDASIGLPYNLSLEAFYQLEQEEYQLDRPGTPFSTSDVISMGSGVGGNENAVSFLTGAPGGNIMRNCTNPSEVSAAFSAAWAGNALRDCSAVGVGGSLDFSLYNPTLGTLGGWPVGNSEALRLAYGDTSVVARDRDRFASDSGQYGIAARWYSEELNNTEFGFYFTNTHSRLPMVSERTSVDPTQVTFSSFLSAGSTSSNTTRGLPYQGCNVAAGPASAGADGIWGTADGGGVNPFGVVVGAESDGFGSQPNAFFGVPIGLTAEQIAQMNQSSTDPDGIFAAAVTIADNFYSDTGNFAMVNAPAGSPFAGGVVGTDLTPLAFLNPAFAGVTVANNSVLAATIINCALIANQAVVLPGAAGTDAFTDPGRGQGVLATDGAEIIFGADPVNPSLGLFLEYPEDIRMYGFSFNSTIGTWGVQGDFTYRPNQPVQLDTDQITIAALNNACTFQQLLGPSAFNVLIPGATGLANPDTLGANCGSLGAGVQSLDVRGFERTDIYTAQVGTTATFTNSNALVGISGADLGILVTEVGMMYAPDAPEATGSATRWANVCSGGGTDLPLGGFLSLAPRPGCRPTSTSWGYVLLGQLQYNSVFGSGFALEPTVAFSHGVKGNSPAPLSNYREGAKSVSLQLNGSYLGNWRGGVSYTNFFGNEKYAGNTDQDFVSMNVSYSF